MLAAYDASLINLWPAEDDCFVEVDDATQDAADCSDAVQRDLPNVDDNVGSSACDCESCGERKNDEEEEDDEETEEDARIRERVEMEMEEWTATNESDELQYQDESADDAADDDADEDIEEHIVDQEFDDEDDEAAVRCEVENALGMVAEEGPGQHDIRVSLSSEDVL